MDNRQQQIREGAGLEESRLNTEFIDFIQRWGGPFLILCAIAMGGWAGWNWWQRQKAQRLDEAFAQYEAQIASGNPNPAALEDVAREFEGVASVSLLARMDAADIYLASVRSGVRSGAQLNPDGTLAPEDALSDDERAHLLGQAESLYQTVYDAAMGAKGKGLLAIKAQYGLGAVSECRGDMDAAKAHYERVVALAEASGLHEHVTLARARIESLTHLETPAVLLATADLAVRPTPPAPEIPGLGPDVSPDAGPAGPVAPSLLEQPLENPLNPEADPGGLRGPFAPGATPTTPGSSGSDAPPTTEPATAPSTAPSGEPSTAPSGEPAPTPPGR